MKKSLFSERVIQVLNLLDVSIRDFSKEMGISYGVIFKWRKDFDTAPAGEGNLVRFCDALLRFEIVCDVDWLKTGQGALPYKLKENPLGAHLQPYGMPSTQQIFRAPSGSKKSTLKALRDIKTVFSEVCETFIFRMRSSYKELGLRKGKFLVATSKNLSPEEDLDVLVVKDYDQRFYLCRVVKDASGKSHYITSTRSTIESSEVKEVLYPVWVSLTYSPDV